MSGNFDLGKDTFNLKLINKKLIKGISFEELYPSIIYQSQYYNLLPLTVLENIKLLNKSASLQYIKEMMNLFLHF